MSKYLYGAAVQGIQGFIFQTNKLKEIVGASELVENICTTLFAQTLYPGCEDPLKKLNDDRKAILNAAGNIKYIFESKEECSAVVRSFPMIVMKYAPGITISQSVVKYNDNFADAVQKLEGNLRIQRNKPMQDLNIGLMGILRSRETGLPATHVRGKSYMDSATFHKLYTEGDNERKDTTQILCRKIFGDKAGEAKLALDMSDITADNDWIAVIHADGNGLGQVVQKIGKSQEKFKEFSKKLNEATIAAARKAWEYISQPQEVDGKVHAPLWQPTDDNAVIPMRPIVLGGDDLTMICRGDLAVPFTQAFLENFESETKAKLSEYLKMVFSDRSDYLTACAGIAFVKSSFPFHFAYHLAESLCDLAKKDTKALFDAKSGNLPASCLMFHKVQDSFVAEFGEIADRELRPQPDISFEFGPFYLKRVTGGRWTIDHLQEMADKLNSKDGNAVKSHLRQWLSLLHDDPELAAQKLERLKSVTPMRNYVEQVTQGEVRTEDGVSYYPVYDILALLTINTQKTR